ncbi:hypothetical protein [Jiangella rhizosphaerae]|uniref:Uncharacterized protein n=1 Tax=Jiangella rhizosphaerae TaxID=2293569 RepID=A0A418KRH8_9ACTN|nr:hypothetical protein [Jiangella rhizosphaerae]RIQ25059.1 hypothetical protein DY240_11670 [Jiangella rhizosphaerae]
MTDPRLGSRAALAGLAGSYVTLLLAQVAVVVALNLPGFLLLAIAVATPIWLIAVLVVGLPVAARAERRLPADASVARRYGAYALAGLVSAGPVALAALILPLGWDVAMAVIALGCGVVCAIGGKAGVELWRRHERARATRTGH